MITELPKNPTISGIKFKTIRVLKRPVHIAEVNGKEIGIAYSDTYANMFSKIAWYWDIDAGARSSRVDQIYFSSPEEALVAVLKEL